MLQHAITPVGRPCAVSHAAVSPRTPPSPPPPHPRTYTSGGGGGIMHGAARRDRGQLPLVTHRGARLALGGMRDTNGWSRRLSGLPEGASATLRRPSGEGSVFRGAHGGGEADTPCCPVLPSQWTFPTSRQGNRASNTHRRGGCGSHGLSRAVLERCFH